jgi:enoyl-CoA hydratase/carnithine racemase
MSTFETILYEVEERVAVITFNRPDRMNAMSIKLCEEVSAAIAEADADDEIKVVIVTGAGGRAFSAGYDIKDDPDDKMELGSSGVVEARWRLNHDLQYTYSPWRCSKPVIAMIDGYCLAGALEFAQMCDMRYASEGSQFAVIETRFANGVATLAMPWILGARCRELIYTGDKISASDALAMGLINRVFAKDELREQTMRIAKRMSLVALPTLQWNKRAINHTFETMGFSAALQYGLEACVMMDATPSPESVRFGEISRAEGLTAAIRWRDSQFAPLDDAPRKP